jgi:TonB family protein
MAGICLMPVLGKAQTSAEESATERLRSLMTTALSAARAGDKVKLEEIAHALVILNHEAWFKETFGEEMGAKLATAYGASVQREEEWLPKLFEMLSKQEGEVLVEDAREPRFPAGNWCGQTLLKTAKNDASFYQAGLERVPHEGSRTFNTAGYFTLVEGAYRRLDCRSLGIVRASSGPLPHPINGPLRVGGNVQAARAINKVQPVYPKEARKDRISGVVRLHVILAKDGTVQQLEVISGHPLLQQAALDAVGQWTYQPTLLNGEPVEVDTTIDIIFTLNNPSAPNP